MSDSSAGASGVQMDAPIAGLADSSPLQFIRPQSPPDRTPRVIHGQAIQDEELPDIKMNAPIDFNRPPMSRTVPRAEHKRDSERDSRPRQDYDRGQEGRRDHEYRSRSYDRESDREPGRERRRFHEDDGRDNRPRGPDGEVLEFGSIREYELAFHSLKIRYPTLVAPDLKPDDNLTLVNDLYLNMYREGNQRMLFGLIKLGIAGIYVVLEYVGSQVMGFDTEKFAEINCSTIMIFDPMINEFVKMMDIRPKKSSAVGWPLGVKFVGAILLQFVMYLFAKNLGSGTGVIGALGQLIRGQTGVAGATAAAAPDFVTGLLGSVGSLITPFLGLITGQTNIGQMFTGMMGTVAAAAAPAAGAAPVEPDLTGNPTFTDE